MTVGIKGWLGVLIILLGAGLIVSWAFGLALVTSIVVILLMVFAPIAGFLVAVFLPLPGILRIIVALAVMALLMLFGLQYLGVM